MRGQVFFASSESLVSEFDFKEGVKTAILDLSHAHFWDITAIESLDRIVHKFRRNGIEVSLQGLNRASVTLVEKYARHDKPGAQAAEPGH